MGENFVKYEGYEGPARTQSRTSADGGLQGKLSTLIDDYPWAALVPAAIFGIGVTLGLRWLAKKIAGGAIGEDEEDFLTGEFSSALGIQNGTLSGLPVKYKWLPVHRGRRGHPASLDLEFTVRNIRGARLRIHKEGPFNKPLASLPPEIQAPPVIESHGYVLRLEPAGALGAEGAKVLDRTIPLLCAAGLYEVILQDDKFSASVIRSKTYEVEETKALLAAAAEAARLFN